MLGPDLLRRRGTSRLWSDKCKAAQERAFVKSFAKTCIVLFLHHQCPSSSLLALDPGFAAGIKYAILKSNATVAKLQTIHHLGNQQRERGIQQLGELRVVTLAKEDKQ